MTYIFTSVQEAQDSNSSCAFCHKEKFAVQTGLPGDIQLVRCTDPKCTKHCKWNHAGELIVPLNQSDHLDVMDIVRGGSR